MSRCRRRGWTLVETLVVIGIIGVLLGLLLPAVQRVRDAGHRARCSSNLRQLGLALTGYHDTQRSLPPGHVTNRPAAAYPYLAWQSWILPFVEQDAAWQQVGPAYARNRVPWNPPQHPGLSTPIGVYGCPSAPATLTVAATPFGYPVALTAYLGVNGTNVFRQDGCLFPDSRIRFGDVADGTSQTILVGERPPSADRVWGWWYAGYGQADDGSADMLLGAAEMNISPAHQGCFRGPYQFAPGRADNPCDIFRYWSGHVAGGHFLFADGSAHFLGSSARATLPALATRAGGETVTLD